MAKMTAAVGAYNFSSRHTESSILVSRYSTRDAVKVGWPSTTRLELVIGLVKRCMASGTSINSLFRIVLVEFAGARSLSSLFSQNAKLLCTVNVSEWPT